MKMINYQKKFKLRNCGDNRRLDVIPCSVIEKCYRFERNEGSRFLVLFT
jgi:hypothetical protein